MRTKEIGQQRLACPLSVGLLASVLFNFYLDDFDRTFINRFPHFPFVWFINEVIVSVPLKKKAAVPFETIKNFLKELQLSAKLIYIIRVGFPIPGGLLSVDNGGFIHFVEKEE
mgnify:CR=1 FL=1